MPTADPNASTFHVRLASGESFGPATVETLAQWAREGRVPRDAAIVAPDGSSVRAADHPVIGPIVNAPPTVVGALQRPQPADEGITALIPYRNGAALAGYYISVFSLIPIIGLVLAPIAIILGALGLSAAKRNPGAKGKAHAWVAIILGTLVLGGHALIILIAATR